MNNRVQNQLTKLHDDLGAWIEVGWYLSIEGGRENPVSLASEANAVANGTRKPSTRMLKALGLFETRRRIAFEIPPDIDAVKFRKWARDNWGEFIKGYEDVK